MSLEKEAFESLENEKMEFESADEVPVNGGFNIDLSFFKAPTGEGSIEDYREHVLNFNRSLGVAQILRGVTGLAGELNLAALDILLGTFRVIREKGASADV